LLEEGNTIPFIARYRKEATGSLDEVQIRDVRDALEGRKALEERREHVRVQLESAGQLSADLAQRLTRASTLAEIEDLYRPFRPKRRTRATVARERGLEPLAALIASQPRTGDPLAVAAGFVRPSGPAGDGVASPEEALAGARDIVAEWLSDHVDIRALCRKVMFERGLVSAKKSKKAPEGRTKFEEYYQFSEPARSIPSHRFLAIQRGEAEGVLQTSLSLDAESTLPLLTRQALDKMGHDRRSPFGPQLELAVADGMERLLLPSIETEVLGQLKERSDGAAVNVFAQNLEDLLLAAPFGAKPVVGIDPGLRTGCKCVALDATGALQGYLTIYLATGAGGLERARKELTQLLQKAAPAAVAVGNGTGGRETEAFAREVVAAAGLSIPVVSVSEAGASVYSASDIAREELPELDVTVRGAVSIARRLQDPLAELVKIDPKSIGVGQYQHDVQQSLLANKLDEVVESCVNRVGVELNTASPALLSRVAGIGPKLAKNIVKHRDAAGEFRERKELLAVSGLGPKTFLQCAGFLRVRGGRNPLDASAVHPERYGLVEQVARDAAVSVAEIVGRPDRVRALPWARYKSPEVGDPTLRDIVDELSKPGRDPRKEFEVVAFRDDVREVEHLKPGMDLFGVVTNVTAFGAFVDIGVHQDGLVHVSKLSKTFVRDPREVVKSGDKIRVKVLEVDVARKRISLERIAN
jgi:uncharacterized protein